MQLKTQVHYGDFFGLKNNLRMLFLYSLLLSFVTSKPSSHPSFSWLHDLFNVELMYCDYFDQSSPTQWTWVWASSRRWWRTGKPGMLQPMGSQRIGQAWATEQQQQSGWTLDHCLETWAWKSKVGDLVKADFHELA